MSVFTFLLEAELQSPNALFKQCTPQSKPVPTSLEFKRRVAQSLVKPSLQNRHKQDAPLVLGEQNEDRDSLEVTNETVLAAERTNHLLLQHKIKRTSPWYLCKIMGLIKTGSSLCSFYEF